MRDSISAIQTSGLWVRGYHGTSRQAASTILRSGFRPSRNAYDWLGDGIYFFQDAPERAWEWATTLFGREAAVVGALIRCELDDWIDLLDIRWASTLAVIYDEFVVQMRRANLPMPRQTGGAHRLDREVINYAIGVLSQGNVIIRAVRAAFLEGDPVYPQSALFDRSHVQIAVRDASLIESIWIEREGFDHGNDA